MARGRIYDPSSTDKNKVEKVLRLLIPSYVYYADEMLRVSIVVYYQMPKSWSDKKKSLYDGTYKVSRPDADNVAKFYLDCMNGILYKDDAQVVSLHCEKRYTSKDGYVCIGFEQLF